MKYLLGNIQTWQFEKFIEAENEKQAYEIAADIIGDALPGDGNMVIVDEQTEVIQGGELCL